MSTHQTSAHMLENIPIHQLHRGLYQPREVFGEGELEELAASIKTTGIIQPISVRETHTDSYEILAGERRWRAAQLAGLTTVPCLIQTCNDEQAALIATIENINRVDLNPIEEAKAYQRLQQEFGYTHEQLAELVGKSRVKITNLLRLLKLDPVVKHYLESKSLSEGYGKVLAGIPLEWQAILATKCVENHWTVRQLEKAIQEIAVPPSTKTKLSKDANWIALEKALSDYLHSPVALHHTHQKGYLEIEFGNLDGLSNLLEKIGFVFNKIN